MPLQVIGLHKYGYGRILEHCLLGAKIMFCKWLTLAKEDDNFVCFPVKPLPTGIALESVKLFIKKYIEGKTAEKIRKVRLAIFPLILKYKSNGRFNSYYHVLLIIKMLHFLLIKFSCQSI